MSKISPINIMSKSSIEKAIKELKSYQKSLEYKCEEFVRRLADIGVPVIDKRMNAASFKVSETTENGGLIYEGADTSHYTHIEVNSFGSYSEAKLIVEGRELLFIEFGAGVYHNGAAGSSPHPKGAELGYVIGYYGKGHGKQKIWGYYADSGELILTHGVKATMPLYNAFLEMYQKVETIAKEVFGENG